jgi:DNA polymerase-3 subunit alpha (Gram-positive type)
VLKEGEAFIIEIPFMESGIDLVNLGKTPGVMSNIVRSEFGIDVKFEIRSGADVSLAREQFFKQQNEELDRMRREAVENASRQAATQHADKSADQSDEPQLTMVRTLYSEDASNEKISESVFRLGNMTFDTKEASVIYGDEFDVVSPTPLRDIVRPARNLVVMGRVNSFEATPTRDNTKNRVTIGITDNDSSINVKVSIPMDDETGFVKMISKSGRTIRRGVQEVVTWYNCYLCVKGSARLDKFDNEIVIYPDSIKKISAIDRFDDAEVKRVELHLHTNLSTMDALIFPEQVIEIPKSWGWDAIGVTDHGNVQAYPLLKDNAKGSGVKILYGMEAYYVDDDARCAFGGDKFNFEEDEFIVFDTETTGLSAINCHLTEIGAVKIKAGEVLDRFNTFVDPGEPIPENIVKLTGITDEMVADAPSEREALAAFMQFCGDAKVLIAHNAPFDMSFMKAAAGRCGVEFPYASIDTVPLSRALLPDLKKVKLNGQARILIIFLGNFSNYRIFGKRLKHTQIAFRTTAYEKLVARLHP